MSGHLRLAVVHPDLRPWRSGHDVAVWRLVAALAERPDVTVTVVTGRVHARLPDGVRVVRLPCLPVWHAALRFLTFRVAWSVAYRFIAPAQDAVYLSSPLWGRGDLAAVHFLSLDWREAWRRRPPPRHWRLRLRHLHDRFRHAIAAPLERRAYERAARGEGPRLLPVSPGLAEGLKERFPGAAERMTMVPNIVDDRRFRPGPEPERNSALRAAVRWSADWPIVLFVGGAWQRKGLPVALEVLARLERSAGLLVVGPGPAEAMRREAERLGIDRRVHFAGAQRDTAPYYRIADVLLIPSAYETDGLVAWEALATGVPVVAAPFPGSEPWLRDGETGFAGEGCEALARGVDRLLADHELRRRCGAAGRRIAADRAPAVIAGRVVALVNGGREGQE